MARIKYSGLIHDISGSIGGTTLQLNAYGATIRNKPKNNASQSLRQNLSRSYVSQVAAAWSALTPSEQSVWDRCQTFFNIKAWSNKSSLLYGRAVFFKYNLLRLQAGLDILDVPSFATVQNLTYTIDFVKVGATLYLRIIPDMLSYNQYMVVSFGLNQSTGDTPLHRNSRICRLSYVEDTYYLFTSDWTDNWGIFNGTYGYNIPIYYRVVSSVSPVIGIEQYRML